MESLRAVSNVSLLAMLPHHCHYHSLSTKKKKNNFRVTANTRVSDDPFHQAAIHAATLRFQESLRPEPLFHDPYVACLIPPNTSVDHLRHAHPYCLATRFIDEKLLRTLRHSDELKQVVLLTDGADTRAYRLTWPRSTLIFDVSAGVIHSDTSQKLKDIGAQVSSSCLLVHVPLESENVEGILREKGFSGSRPSIWVLQGLPIMTLASFEDVLLTVGNLAMKGSLLLGEIPSWLTETGLQHTNREEWVHNFFMSNGFQVQLIDYGNIAKSLSRELLGDTSDSLLFVAEHLRFSDDQMVTWRTEFQRAEEEGDEDGFEDL